MTQCFSQILPARNSNGNGCAGKSPKLRLGPTTKESAPHAPGISTVRCASISGMKFLGALALVLLTAGIVWGGEPPESQAKRLFRTGQTLVERTHYFEALDLFNEARLLLESARKDNSEFFSDILFALARAKIKARLHQRFPASYVKTALRDVREANGLRERLPDVLPQKLAEGYYLEGMIHKRFFMRRKKARSLFEKTIKLDPGNAAAKRELSELIVNR